MKSEKSFLVYLYLKIKLIFIYSIILTKKLFSKIYKKNFIYL